MLKDKPVYGLYFLCLYLPFYLTLQIMTYQFTNSVILVTLLKVLKEFMVFAVIFSWLLYKKKALHTPLKLHTLDYLFIAFTAYLLLFTILPIGPVGILGRLNYFRNMLVLVGMYFLGRTVVLNKQQVGTLFKIIFAVTVLAFVLGAFEKLTNTHFQSLIGYSRFSLDISNIEPAGSYGLTWTFQAESGAKRFAAFFASPLELGPAMLISFAAAFFLFLRYRDKVSRLAYGALVMLSVAGLFFSYSRAALLGFFMLLFFIALILGYYRLIYLGVLVVVVFLAGIFLLAGDDLRYFVIDTINLADSSSLGHVVEWLEGLESIASNPQGLGLGTSGNAGGVDDEFKIGGENQFIIFGVQLGVPFLLIYLALVFCSIYYPVKAFKISDQPHEQIIAFVAATFKFAFILALMTANAENYLYVAYLSWWMVGQSVTTYYQKRYAQAA